MEEALRERHEAEAILRDEMAAREEALLEEGRAREEALQRQLQAAAQESRRLHAKLKAIQAPGGGPDAARVRRFKQLTCMPRRATARAWRPPLTLPRPRPP